MNCMLVIRCSKTGQEIQTGIVVDIHTFEGLPAGASQLQCPACGNRHVWSPGDAMLAPTTDIWRGASLFDEQEKDSRTN
jgi:hypothetical protein